MKKFKFHIYSKILLVDFLLVVLMSYFIPILSGYPPYSEEASFQIQIEGLSHLQQYIIFGTFGFILHFIFLRIFFKNCFKFLDGCDNNKSFDKSFILKVREDCFSINRKLFYLQFSILLILLFLLFINVKISIVLCVKFLLIYFSFMMSEIIIYLLLIKDDINLIIRKTYNFYDELELNIGHTKFNVNLIINLLPFFFIVTITSCLLGYSKVCDKIGESEYYYYNLHLDSLQYSNMTIDDLKYELSNIPLKNSSDYYMIIFDKNDKDSIYFSSSKGNVTDFFLLYLNTFSSKTNGRIYEYFGVEEQAYIKDVTLASGENISIGFKYSNTNLDIILFFTYIVIFSCFAFTIILSFWAKHTSKNIVEVSNRLEKIVKNQNVQSVEVLPILSNDELGDLTSNFNKIQFLTNNYIKKLKDSQDTLMESERLASLGQLIGGIAHNLKTPIMSISGATEGIVDLIKEYDASIDDPEVNSKDHHEIANDMLCWTDKIKEYTAYMSDVITAVKGQAVAMSETDNITFDIEELVKRVNILMRHELKSAIVYLNVSLKVSEHTTLHGDINSLIQVINNMISNSIQAYNGKPEQSIDLSIYKDDKNNLVISIKDYGPGLPEKVKEKLFSEMITTKGKNGTGLGLYMSYSTIKAHFGGDITYQTEAGKGTTFNIVLPL